MEFRTALEALARAEVDFVVVGGVCAVLHGVPATTFDLDIVHARDVENCQRLHRVLEELDACYREHLPRRLSPTIEDLTFPGHHLLMTSMGPIDVMGRLVGDRDYADLLPVSAWVQSGEETRVRVLDLATLVKLKEEIGREKDLAQLPLLRRTLEERGES